MMVPKCLIYLLFYLLWAQKSGKTESQGRDISEVTEIQIGVGKF